MYLKSNAPIWARVLSRKLSWSTQFLISLRVTTQTWGGGGGGGASFRKMGILSTKIVDRKWQDYVYIQCEYKSTKQKIKHLLREENKVKENKIS